MERETEGETDPERVKDGHGGRCTERGRRTDRRTDSEGHVLWWVFFFLLFHQLQK